MTLLVMLCSLTGAWAQNELTVYEDGTDNNSYVPFYGLWADTQGTTSECVIPSDELTAMAGGNITAMKFYLKQPADEAWTGTHQVYLGEVAETTLTGITGPDAFTVVATASFDATGTELTVTFDNPYTYGGGNLLIGTYVSEAGNWKSAYFYGVNQEENTARYRSSGSGAGSEVKFIPKTTFTYSGGSGVVIEKPQTLEASSITSSGAVLTWTGGTGTYNLEYKKVADEEWTVVLSNTTATTYTFTGLESNTKYQARVRSVSGSDVSGWKSLSFTTAIPFPYTEDFTAGLPATWTRYTGLLENILNNSATLASATNSWSVGTGNGVLDGNHAYANIYSNYQRWLVTPTILLPASAKMTFDVAYTAYSGTSAAPAQNGDDDKFVVLISTDGMATWTILRQWDNAGSTFVLNDLTPAGENVSIALGDYAGQSVNVAFYAESTVNNADNNLHIDNVTFQEKDPFEKPTGLSVNYTSDLTATVTWTAAEGAISYDINVNGTVTEGVSSPYELTGLLLSSTYEVKVRANYGESNYSEWTAPVTFKTNDCMEADKCYITYELSVTSGYEQYGWYYSRLLVYNDVNGDDTDELLDAWTVEANEGTATGALLLCPGTNLRFEWYSNNANNDGILIDKVIVRDANGEDIINQTGALTAAVNYTVDCTVTPWHKPTNLAASEIESHSAVLSWKENSDPEATAWVLAYKADGAADFTEVNITANPYTLEGLTPATEYTVKVRPATDEAEKWSDEITFTTTIPNPAPTDISFNLYPTTAEASWNSFAQSYEVQYALMPAEGIGEGWLQYDDGNPFTNIGNSSAADRTWGVKYPGSMATGNKLTKVSFYENADYYTTETTVHINIYSGGDNAPGTLVHTEDVTALGTSGFHEVTFESPVAIAPGKPLWITLTVNGTYVMAACQVNNYDNQWWYTSGSWSNMAEDNPNLAGYGWLIRGYFESEASEITWTTASTTEKSYEITGLTPETTYLIQIRGDFGSDGISEWATSVFTTLALDATPTDLAADVTATTATLNWTGYQDSYNVRYRSPSFFEGFENGIPFTWTTIDQDGDGNNWMAVREMGTIYTYYQSADFSDYIYKGNNAALSASAYNNPGGGYTALGSNNWLISPMVNLSGTLKFYVKALGGYGDEYEVLLSTTDTETESFTTTLKEMGAAPGYWDEVSIDLSAYQGQQGYIAIHHVYNDGYFFLVDNFGILEDNWTNESNISDWQVQGNLTEGTTEWSEPATFTTNAFIELADNATDNSDIITDYAGKVADVTLTGRTLYKDGKWNTICLPFDVTIEGSVLEGAIARELTDASISGSTLNLTFDETAVSTLVAGTPYIIRWASGEDIVSPVFNGVTIDANADNSFDSGSGETRVRFLGTYDALSFSDDDNESVLLMGGNNELRYANAKAGLGACRAYFKIGDDSHAARRLTAFHTNLDDETMGIRSIENGPLTKDNDNAWYSLDGRRLVGKPTMKGVYINKGNKITIK